jgi:hypothetical protein
MRTTIYLYHSRGVFSQKFLMSITKNIAAGVEIVLLKSIFAIVNPAVHVDLSHGYSVCPAGTSSLLKNLMVLVPLTPRLSPWYKRPLSVAFDLIQRIFTTIM